MKRTIPLAAAALAFLGCLLSAFGQEIPNLSAKEVVEQLTTRNQERADALRNFTGMREYRVAYAGFSVRKEAEMLVRASYEAPDKKQFSIVSQHGSGFLINKILKRLLESEQEAATPEQKARTALTERNYDFELAGQDIVAGRPAYVLRVIPKTDNKFLYRGKAWIDAQDFAVSRIEAEPAKRPSFWISKTRIAHSYVKIGHFWLPAENRSTTDVRLGGSATLTIHYSDYTINQN